MARKREYATERLGEVDPSLGRPMTPIQALMECAPGDEPDASTMELLALRELVVDAIDELLTEQERWLFNALYVEQRSLREVGRMTSIPKTSLSRIRDNLQRKLADELHTHPLIQKRLRK